MTATGNPTGESDLSSTDPAAAVSTKQQRRRGFWRIIATLCFVAVVAVGVLVFCVPSDDTAALGWVTVVIGNWVPTWRTVQLALVGAGFAALVTSWVIAPPPPARRGRALRIILAVALVIAVPVSMLGLVFFANSRYTVLPERSDGGCRVVVREFSFLLLGWGNAGIVQPGSWTVDWVGEYDADDGYMPFSDGAYSLTWKGRDADLEVWGDRDDPTEWSGDQPVITCAR